jgi:uncharacterized protein GlcG (DUF336 family)
MDAGRATSSSKDRWQNLQARRRARFHFDSHPAIIRFRTNEVRALSRPAFVDPVPAEEITLIDLRRSCRVFYVSLTVCSGLSLLVATGLGSQAQVLSERSVSLQMARTIADAALSACRSEGFDVSSVVVDRTGAVKVLLRADNANPHNAELARRKAFTARTFHITSMEFQKRTAEGSPLAAQRNLADVIALGGGVPILIGNEAIGGVGVSGSPSQEQDEKCAAAGVAAVEQTLR